MCCFIAIANFVSLLSLSFFSISSISFFVRWKSNTESLFTALPFGFLHGNSSFADRKSNTESYTMSASNLFHKKVSIGMNCSWSRVRHRTLSHQFFSLSLPFLPHRSVTTRYIIHFPFFLVDRITLAFAFAFAYFTSFFRLSSALVLARSEMWSIDVILFWKSSKKLSSFVFQVLSAVSQDRD